MGFDIAGGLLKVSARFPDKETADKIKQDIAAAYPRARVDVRRSLPEFRGHVAKGFTVYVQALTMADDLYIRKMLKNK
ncbi:MAG: hypothetical protein ABIJ57_00125 [Pseudomonadota bacterium]